MAIVATYQTKICPVRVDDTYCRDVPPEEMRRRQEETRRVAGAILTRAQLREMGINVPE